MADRYLGWIVGLEWKTALTLPKAGLEEVLELLDKGPCWLVVVTEDPNRFFLVPKTGKRRKIPIDGNVGRCLLQAIDYMLTPNELRTATALPTGTIDPTSEATPRNDEGTASHPARPEHREEATA